MLAARSNVTLNVVTRPRLEHEHGHTGHEIASPGLGAFHTAHFQAKNYL